MDRKSFERLKSEWAEPLRPCDCGTPAVMDQDGVNRYHTSACSQMRDIDRRGRQTVQEAREVICGLLSEVVVDSEVDSVNERSGGEEASHTQALMDR